MRPKAIPPVYSEKRAVLRARRTRAAHCVFDDGATVLEVALRNISPLGARIAGSGLIGLPQTFELRVPDGAGGYSARQAAIVWAKGTAAGVKFIDKP